MFQAQLHRFLMQSFDDVRSNDGQRANIVMSESTPLLYAVRIRADRKQAKILDDEAIRIAKQIDPKISIQFV